MFIFTCDVTCHTQHLAELLHMYIVCALLKRHVLVSHTVYLDCCAAGSPAASQIKNSSHLPDNYMLILTIVFEEPAILNEA